MIEHDGCTGCKYFNDNEVTHSSPCYDCEGSHSQNKLKDNYTPMSKADKIKAMNDEELAEFLSGDQCCMMSETWPKKDIYEWLQSEVKESEQE